jgi:hypothetical protein
MPNAKAARERAREGAAQARRLMRLPVRLQSPFRCRPRKRKGPVSRAFRGGRTWDRTRDLPRVKRALSR